MESIRDEVHVLFKNFIAGSNFTQETIAIIHKIFCS